MVDEVGIEKSDFVDPEELRDYMDAEVKRVSDMFRFVLKYKEHFQPSGVEFSGLRTYVPSDDASRIDWKISAGKPQDLFVKEFDEEHDMDVFIVLDVSDTMMFGTGEELKSEYAALMSAALAYASVDAGIDVGLGMWGGGEPLVVTPDGGFDQYSRILHEVTDFDRYGGRFDLEEALNDVIGQIKGNTSVFIISDFLDVGGEWKSKMQLMNEKFRHHMAVMVRDLRDYELPEAGNFRFESPSGGDQLVVNTNQVKQEFDNEAQQEMQRIEEKIRGTGASFLRLDTKEQFARRFAEFFEDSEGGW